MSIMSEVISSIGTLLTVLGVALTIVNNRRARELKTITWLDLQSATKFFWKKLKSIKFEPTFIVTPGQKGGIIAQLLSDFYEEEIPIITGFLKSKDEKQVKDDNYLVLSTTKWHVHIPTFLKTYEKKDTVKLLIVDDFVMSGDFLGTLKELLLELGYLEKNICSCAVAVTTVAMDAHKGPTYYWKLASDKNFYFPWGKAK